MGSIFKSSNEKYLVNPERTLASDCVCIATEIQSSIEVVVKIFKPNKRRDIEKTKILAKRELVMFNKGITHPNIISYIEVDRIDSAIFVYMPRYDSNFQKFMVERGNWGCGFSEEDARTIFREFCEPIKFLHSMKIAHRDIKLENYLVRSEEGKFSIVLADFELSYDWADRSSSRSEYVSYFNIGSPVYMAPELVKLGEYKVTSPDMWALGVCLYILLFGKFPFWGGSTGEVAYFIREYKYEIPENNFELTTLIRKIFVKDSIRPTINDILGLV